MDTSQEADIVTRVNIDTSLCLIKNYLDLVSSFSKNGVCREDVLGFESSFEVDAITSSLGIKGFTAYKSRMGLDVAMEGILDVTLEERGKVMREYFDSMQRKLNESKRLQDIFKTSRAITNVKNHPKTAKLRTYSETFTKEWDAIMEHDPASETRLAALLITQTTIVMQVEKALQAAMDCKDALYLFLSEPIHRNQSELDLKHRNSYRDLSVYLEIELNLNFAKLTGGDYKVATKEPTLENPAVFNCLKFIKEQNDFISEMKETDRLIPLKELPIVSIEKLPDSAFTGITRSAVPKHQDKLSVLLKDARTALIKDATQIKRFVALENKDFIIERDVIELNILFTTEVFEIVTALINIFIELEKFKTGMVHTILELKSTLNKL